LLYLNENENYNALHVRQINQIQKMNWASVKEFLLVPKTPVGTILPVQKVYLDSIFGISIFLENPGTVY
jgi:hypothetical protein